MKIVYGSKVCPKCKELVKELTEKQEVFKYIDVNTLTPDKIENIVEKTGQCSLPIIIKS